MNTIDKIKKSWWVLISFIFMINGFGFIYIGFRHNNRNWLLEGIMYEIPWFFYFILFARYGSAADGFIPYMVIIGFGLLMMLASIIRSIWVAIKLCDVYDNEEKYTIKSTSLNNQNNPQEKDHKSGSATCCVCIIFIFIVFAIMAIL